MFSRSILRLIVGILLGLVLTSGVAALFSQQFYPLAWNRSNSDAGSETFNARCSGCHHAVPSASAKMGPNLSGIGLDAISRVAGKSAVEYLLESIMQPDAFVAEGIEGRMPSGTVTGLTPNEIRNLLAFLASRGAEPNFGELAKLEIPDVPNDVKLSSAPSVDTVQRGWALFSRELGCTACHSIFGEPGSDLEFPSLAKVANLSEEYLVESLRKPNAQILAGYSRFTAIDNTGKPYSGRLLASDGELLRLMTKDEFGNYTIVEKSRGDFEEFDVSKSSLMPAYDLSDEDEHALVTFLKFLKAEVN